MAGTIVTIAAAVPWGTLIERAPRAIEMAAAAYDRISAGLKERAARQKAAGGRKPTQAERIEALEADVSSLSSQLMSLGDLAKSTSELNQGLLAQVARNKKLLATSLAMNAVCLVGLLVVALRTF